MPALAISNSIARQSSDRASRFDELPVHLSPIAAAEIESLVGGRHGRMTRGQLPRLQAIWSARAGDTDLGELIRAIDRDGAVEIRFL